MARLEIKVQPIPGCDEIKQRRWGNTIEYLNLYNGKRSRAKILKSLIIEEEGDEKRLNKVIEKFDEHFVPKRNVIYELAKFHQRKQQLGESADVFIR